MLHLLLSHLLGTDFDFILRTSHILGHHLGFSHLLMFHLTLRLFELLWFAGPCCRQFFVQRFRVAKRVEVLIRMLRILILASRVQIISTRSFLKNMVGIITASHWLWLLLCVSTRGLAWIGRLMGAIVRPIHHFAVQLLLVHSFLILFKDGLALVYNVLHIVVHLIFHVSRVCLDWIQSLLLGPRIESIRYRFLVANIQLAYRWVSCAHRCHICRREVLLCITRIDVKNMPCSCGHGWSISNAFLGTLDLKLVLAVIRRCRWLGLLILLVNWWGRETAPPTRLDSSLASSRVGSTWHHNASSTIGFRLLLVVVSMHVLSILLLKLHLLLIFIVDDICNFLAGWLLLVGVLLLTIVSLAVAR